MQWLAKWLLDKRFFFFNFDVLIVILLIIRLLFRCSDGRFLHNILSCWLFDTISCRIDWRKTFTLYYFKVKTHRQQNV